VTYIIKIIKNKSLETIRFLGIDLSPNGEYNVPSCKWDKMRDIENIYDLIDAGTLVVNNGIKDLSASEGKHLIRIDQEEHICSLAIDRNNVDQDFDGTNWTELTAERILWDLNNNYNIETNEFTVPKDGIYYVDIQLRLKSLISVGEVELALFKRTEAGDDYWFILDNKSVTGSSVHLSGATSFDMYKDEIFVFKAKLSGGLFISGKIDGNDDYTAWGITFQKPTF